MFYLYKARRNLRLNPSSLQEMQNKRLRAIIKHAYENVPFYHKKFDAAKIKPTDVKSVSDLSKVPIATKSEIKASSLEDTFARNFDIEKCFKKSTSGSNGMPLTIFIDLRGQVFEGAVYNRAFFENGLRLRDKLAFIRDPHHNPEPKVGWSQRLGIMRRRQISVFDDAEKQLALLEEYRPDVIEGYSSALFILADFCRNRTIGIKPRLIFTGSELLLSAHRELISSVFNAELFDYYGCKEFGYLSWECHEHIGYHMNVDSVVMEFIDNGESVAFGERGEIVCTTLVNYAIPLIRYHIDDVGVPIEEECSCGRTLPLMRVVEGRKNDFLISLDGRVISPLVFFPYPFESVEAVKKLRVIQERRDKLTFQLVVRESFLNTPKVFEKAREEIQNLFGKGMHVEFQILDDIPKDPSGKLRAVISKLHSSN